MRHHDGGSDLDREEVVVLNERPPAAGVSPWLKWAAFAAVAAAFAAGGVWAWRRGPMPQDLAYHDFADQRTLFGIPHALNVLSNVPFLIVGSLGLGFLFGPDARRPGGPFLTPAERWPFVLFFIGVGLTGVGSAHYHLDPDNDRLLWDRLPMAVAFMALAAAVLADRVGPRFGLAMLLPLVAAGLASVLYWHWTERRGAGDLRPYFLVQFGTMLALPAFVLLAPRYTGAGYLFATLGWYVLAKVCEQPLDRPIYRGLGGVSGHTVKHLTAAVATYCVLLWLQRRAPAAGAADGPHPRPSPP